MIIRAWPVLAAGSSHSFDRSLWRSFLASPLTNSFRSPHQLQHRTCKCFVPQHPHLSQPTPRAFQFIFTCEVFAPLNRFPIIVALFSLHWSFHHAIEMRITAHAPPGASYFPFQQHIIIIPEIWHFLFIKICVIQRLIDVNRIGQNTLCTLIVLFLSKYALS